MWKGQTFRFPISTLHKKKKNGGWDLINMKAKGRALFLHRMRTQSQRSGTVTLEWIRSWDLESQSNNPPCREKIPPALEYLRQYAMDAAYVPLQGSSESLQTYKRRMYDTLHTMLRAESGTQEMRITRLWPHTDCSTVWKNVGEAPERTDGIK